MMPPSANVKSLLKKEKSERELRFRLIPTNSFSEMKGAEAIMIYLHATRCRFFKFSIIVAQWHRFQKYKIEDEFHISF
jgi:hypothetical protein